MDNNKKILFGALLRMLETTVDTGINGGKTEAEILAEMSATLETAKKTGFRF